MGNIENTGSWHLGILCRPILENWCDLVGSSVWKFQRHLPCSLKIDPACHYILAHFARGVMLYFTKIQLELLTNIQKLKIIESGIRGEVSQCCNRYAASNKPYMTNYDPSEENLNIYILYFDVNNCYGWAMTQYLLYTTYLSSEKKNLHM